MMCNLFQDKKNKRRRDCHIKKRVEPFESPPSSSSPPSSPKKSRIDDHNEKRCQKSSDSLVSLVRNAKNPSEFYTPPDEDVTPVTEPVFSSDGFNNSDVHSYLVYMYLLFCFTIFLNDLLLIFSVQL